MALYEVDRMKLYEIDRWMRGEDFDTPIMTLYEVACWMRIDGFAFNTPIMVNGTFISLRKILFDHDERVVKDFQGTYYGGYGFVVEG